MVLLSANVKEDVIIAIREIPRRKAELSSQKQHKQFRMKQEQQQDSWQGNPDLPRTTPICKNALFFQSIQQVLSCFLNA